MITHLAIRRRILSAVTTLWLLCQVQQIKGLDESMAPPFADELSATTAICIWSDDAQQLARQWQGTQLFQVLAADTMRPFWEDLRQKKGALGSDGRWGLPWSQFVDVAAGNWVVGYNFSDGAPGVLLIMDVRGKELAAVNLTDNLGQRWQGEGLEVRRQPQSWGTIVVARHDDEQRCAFVRGGRLYVTNQPRLVRKQTGEGDAEPPLSETAAYPMLSAAKQSAPSGSLRFYLDPWRLARDGNAIRDPAAANRMEFFRQHGFDAVRAVIGHVAFQAGEHDLQFVVDVLVRFPLVDAATLLSFTSSQDFRLPPFAPRDIAGMACMHLDVRSALKGYGHVYDEVYGEKYVGAFDDLLNSLAEDPDGPQIDLRTELFGTLSGKVTRVYDFGAAITKTNPIGRRELWAAESVAPEQTAQAIAKFFLHDPDVVSSASHGVPIWHARSSGLLLGDDPENPVTFRVDALGVMQGNLVLATDRQWLIDLVGAASNTVPTLVGATWQASAATPRVAQSWRNLRAVARELHRRIQEQRLQPTGTWEESLLWFLMSKETEHGRQLVCDGALLPPFSSIEKQFGFELIEASVTPIGWRLEGRILRPQP